MGNGAVTHTSVNRWLLGVIAIIMSFTLGAVVNDRIALGKDLRFHETRITVIEQNYVTKDDLNDTLNRIVRCLNRMQNDMRCEL